MEIHNFYNRFNSFSSSLSIGTSVKWTKLFERISILTRSKSFTLATYLKKKIKALIGNWKQKHKHEVEIVQNEEKYNVLYYIIFFASVHRWM